MKDKQNPAQGKIEQALSSAGAKVADANDISKKIKNLNEKGQEKLEMAQGEISDLYESLDELDIEDE